MRYLGTFRLIVRLSGPADLVCGDAAHFLEGRRYTMRTNTHTNHGSVVQMTGEDRLLINGFYFDICYSSNSVASNEAYLAVDDSSSHNCGTLRPPEI